MRRMGRPKFVAVFCLSIILPAMWGLSEALLHLHFFYQQGRWLFQRSENFQVTYVKPVDDRREYTLRENARDGLYHINAQGFRSPDLPVDLAERLICVIGDSVPFGSGVSNDHTFPVYLERMLQRQGYAYRVLNGGVASYNLRQSFDRWDFDIRPQYPCEVLIVNGSIR